MLTPNPGLILWTIATFLVLAYILKKFAWGPILESLRKREEHIRTSIERAEQAKDEAARTLEENRKQLARAEADVQRMLNEGRSLGEKMKNEVLDQANKQSRLMVEQARQQIERDKDAALAQLRGEVASLAIKAAEKILDETLDQAKQGKIVDAYLKTLPKN
jgi:F-type H+-transporting ATPase subunit b